MKHLIVLISLLTITACQSGKSSNPTSSYEDSEIIPGQKFIDKECSQKMEALDGRPTILVVGDSISIGYTPTVREEFPDFQVIHNPCNAQNSIFGAVKIKEWLKHSERWNVCTINHGIWDLMRSSKYGVSVSNYTSNLRYEVTQLKKVCDVVVFANTTHIPSKATTVARENLNTYNQAAEELMNEMNVPVCDLNTVSNNIVHLHAGYEAEDNVHWNDEGSEVLGRTLTNCINESM
jgi:lysophospholipase L1-like esterase